MKSLGIDPATGDELYLTSDGKVTNIWNSADQVVVGNTEPDAQGSLGMNVQWKHFSLYATFMYEWGGQRYNQTLADKIEDIDIYAKNADRRALTDRWQKPWVMLLNIRECKLGVVFDPLSQLLVLYKTTIGCR